MIDVPVILDTHIFFWWLTDPDRLRPAHLALFDDRSNAIHVSAVSGWEIAIKVKLGKWPEAASLVPGLRQRVLNAGLQPLDLTLQQSELAGSLELVHRDPFDRLLAAQALDLDIPLATVDPALAQFGCRII